MFKYSFKNLGPIVEGGELELSDLTVLCGHNNTGKTYIAYSLYGFLTSLDELLSKIIFKSFQEKIFDDIEELTFPTEINIGNQEQNIFQKMLNDYVKESLSADLLGAENPSLFKETEINFNLANDDQLFKEPIDTTFNLVPLETIFSLKKEENSYNIIINKIEQKKTSKHEGRLLIYFLSKEIAKALNEKIITNVIPHAFIASTERTGALIFKHFFQQVDELPTRLKRDLERSSKIINDRFDLTEKQLNIIQSARERASSAPFRLSKHQKTSEKESDLLNSLDEDTKNIIISQQVIINEIPFRFGETARFGKADTPYFGLPKAVMDNVDYLKHLEIIYKEESFILKEHPDLLQDFNNIAGGQYVINDGILNFRPNKSAVSLSMQTTSSAVRSLALLNFYLRHTAKKGDLLMIDEPEMNLHPENQIKMAKFLVQLTKIGIKVFVTTHSSIIIKELNNLMALNYIVKNNKASDDDLKSYYRSNDAISPEKVRIYMLLNEDGKIKFKPAEKNGENGEFGFDVSSFDDTIEKINTESDVLSSFI